MKPVKMLVLCNIVWHLLLALCISPVFSPPIEVCENTGTWLTIQNVTTCVQFSNSVEKMLIRQTEVEYHHQMIDHYTFFFPQVKIDCECTCDVNTPCTASKQNYCDKHQTYNSTCSNLEYRGVDLCPEYYKVCCQVHFSVHSDNQNSKYEAYQLRLKDQRYTFQVSFLINNESFNTTWKIPNWIKNIIIDENKMLLLNISEEPKNLQFDLSMKWIYYWKTSGDFYTNVPINEYDYLEFDKMGWFQRDRKDNIMSRISRWSIQQHSTLKLHKCNDGNPEYTWTLNANNYYRGDSLNTILKGEPFSKLYGKHVTVSKNQFFNGKPSFSLRKQMTLATQMKVSFKWSVPFAVLTTEPLSQNVTLRINQLPQTTYKAVILENDVHLQQLFIFYINSSTKFPLNLTAVLSHVPSPNSLLCLVPLSGDKEDAVCFSMYKLFTETNFTTVEPTNHRLHTDENESGTNYVAIFVPVCVCLLIVVIVVIVILVRKTTQVKGKIEQERKYSPIPLIELSTRGPSSPPNEPIINPTNCQSDDIISDKEIELTIDLVSVGPVLYRLGRTLGLSENDRTDLDQLQKRLHETINKMIDKWKTIKGINATKTEMINCLKIIGRLDIVEKITIPTVLLMQQVLTGSNNLSETAM